jgi:hypothetical protein
MWDEKAFHEMNLLVVVFIETLLSWIERIGRRQKQVRRKKLISFTYIYRQICEWKRSEEGLQKEQQKAVTK